MGNNLQTSRWVNLLWRYSIVLSWKVSCGCTLTYFLLQYHATTTCTEAITVTDTLIVVEDLGITRVTVATYHVQMLGSVQAITISPFSCINQLSTDMGITVLINDTSLLLVNIRDETDRLY